MPNKGGVTVAIEHADLHGGKMHFLTYQEEGVEKSISVLAPGTYKFTGFTAQKGVQSFYVLDRALITIKDANFELGEWRGKQVQVENDELFALQPDGWVKIECHTFVEFRIKWFFNWSTL